MKAGIVGWGAYVPIYRIKTEEIARVWGEQKEHIEKGLGILEKAVGDIDEDAVTIGVEAAKIALKRAGIEGKEIGALFIGSESHPYVVKSSASIIAEAVGATPEVLVADLEFACRAGTAGMIITKSLVESGKINYGMAIGADTAQGRPGDALEYSAGSGGAAFILGKEPVAVIEDTYTFVTDTPDFWRREGADYPSHGGRFTGEPAYFKHVLSATKGLLEKTGYKIEDFDHVILHQPNAKFPKAAAKRLGVKPEQLQYSLLVPIIGNTYSGSVMVALANVLDHAKPGDKILMTSFGSGAGSDSFAITVTDKIEEVKTKGTPLEYFIQRKRYINYADYIKMRKKLKR
jgi:hydroxymethylglutaryl-CoA synthase